MADDPIDLDALEKEIDQDNKVEKRIRDLSEKVKLASEERDTLRKTLEERDREKSELEKEKNFLSSFGEQTTKYPDAIAYRDQIRERVLKGYSAEDATVAVLAAEGKFFKAERREIPSPAGGSAVTTPPVPTDKKVAEMSREEKRQALVEAEKRGDIGVS